MTDYRLRIEGIRKKLLLGKFRQELEEYKQFEFDIEDKRKENLEKIVESIETGKKNSVNDVKFRDKMIIPKNVYTSKIEDYFTKLDNIVYKKRWNSMKDFHKEKKLEEWVDEQQLSKDKKKSLLIDVLEAFKDKKIHTEKSVEYNKDDMKIECIRGIEIDNKTDSYNVLKKKKL